MDPISLSLMTCAATKIVETYLDDEKKGKLVATLVGGVLGNMAYRAVCAGFTTAGSASWNFFKNLRTKDPALNHDLERATREAYLLATQELARQARERTAVASAGRQFWHAGDAEGLAAMQRGIEADLKNGDDTLPARLDDAHLFLLDPATAPAERLKRLRATLRANLDADLARWLPAGVARPAALGELLEQGWTIDTAVHRNVPRDWYSLIAIAFIEKLKTLPRLQAVFESKLLAEVAAREPAAAPMATFAGFTQELDTIAAPLQGIEDSLGILLRDVAEIKTDLREIKLLVEDLSTQRAVQLALVRQIEDGERRRMEELAVRDGELRRLRDDLTQTAAQHEAARAELQALVAERARLTETIAARDRTYAAEVAEYRRQIASLTQDAGPELQRALQRLADGDRLGAFPAIEQLIRAENRGGPGLKEQFDEHVCVWKNETAHSSSVKKAVAHPSYLKIIELAGQTQSHEVERLLLRETRHGARLLVRRAHRTLRARIRWGRSTISTKRLRLGLPPGAAQR